MAALPPPAVDNASSTSSSTSRTTDFLPDFIPFGPDPSHAEEPPLPKKQKTSREKWDDIVKIVNSRGKKLDFENAKSLVPWCRTRGKYSTDVIGLHCEIEDFYEYMRPTETEHRLRWMVFRRVKQTILQLWPGAIVDCFGSFATNLYLPTSDIDVVVIGKWEQLPLRTLEQAFRATSFIEKDTIRVIDKASVPILKIVDVDSKIRVDVSFNVTNGVQSARMIAGYISEFPSLPKLMFVLKQFLLQRDLNEVFTGGVGSYCLVLMVISFLQLHFSKDMRKRNHNLGVLLIEFFELYGRHFNYVNTGIRIRDGGRYMPKADLFPGQPEAVRSDSYRPPLLCIEDPLQPSNDIGKSSYGVIKAKQAFEVAFITLSKAVLKPRHMQRFPANTLLSLIVDVGRDVIKYRQWVENEYRDSELLAPEESEVSEQVEDGWISSDLSVDEI